MSRVTSTMTNSIAFERWWPIGASLAVVAIWFSTGGHFPENPDNLFGASASVASVFASFLGVSKAIMLSIRDSRAYKALVKTGHIEALFDYLRSGIVSSIIFAALSIVGFLADKKAEVRGYNLFGLFQFGWLFFATLSVFTYLRISNILFKLLKQP